MRPMCPLVQLLFLIITAWSLPGFAQTPSCDCTVVAEVVAIDQPWQANRLGTTMPTGKIFALRRDVVPIDWPTDEFGRDLPITEPPTLEAGRVRLRSGKRPRPLVLRVNEGQCLEIQFQNLLAFDFASIYAVGLEPMSVPGQQPLTSLGTLAGTNPIPETMPAPNAGVIYKYYASSEGTFLLYSGPAGANSALIQSGLFGMVNVEPPGAEYYRSQITREGLEQVTMNRGSLPAGARLAMAPEAKQLSDSELQRYDLLMGPSEKQGIPVLVGQTGRLMTLSGHPLINYGATDEAGLPLLRMTRPTATADRLELVYADVTALITGPNAGRFPDQQDHPRFQPNPTAPDRRQPFREFSVLYHFVLNGMTQAFPIFSFPSLSSSLESVIDAFGINYGMAGMGSEIIASRFGVGPQGINGDEVDLKFEEFFLSSWAVGDPAMIVDVPANAAKRFTKEIGEREETWFFELPGDQSLILSLNAGQLVPTLEKAFADRDTPLANTRVRLLRQAGPNQTGIWALTANSSKDSGENGKTTRFLLYQKTIGNFDLDIYRSPDPHNESTLEKNVMRRATKAFFPDDPSNVFHSYLGDHVVFRVVNATQLPHVHHVHAHQWLRSPNNGQSDYIDSQLMTEGTSFSQEIVYGGSGNRNQTIGDSIFHCHFYPHFANGMWALWRVHDVFEAGTIMAADGRVQTRDQAGNLIWNRALPDGEIATGTPIPAVTPLPTLAMAPLPAAVRLAQAEDAGPAGFNLAGRRVIVQPRDVPDGTQSSDMVPSYDNPGFPFFVPAVAGHRPVHPPLDFAWVEDDAGQPVLDDQGQRQYLNGGLPRHQVLGGQVVHNMFSRWDYSKNFIRFKTHVKKDQTEDTYLAGNLIAFELPEEGTALEQAAMDFHAQPGHPSTTPTGLPAMFTVNGLPPTHGAPYADPARDDRGQPVKQLRRYKAANIQMDVVFNKKGWHFPQQRLLTLWYDVKPTLSGERPPEPFFFRANSGDAIEYWHTNLVPNYYDLDDFQVRSPTDILGQHIHLVKFDVMASDGGANGFNYEDGTFAPDEVRERIIALNQNRLGSEGQGGLLKFDPISQFAATETQRLHIQPYTQHYPFLGPEPAYQNWDGAQTTIQRWYTDPLLNERGEDRTIRTVFTHDHFHPSTNQHTGLYAGLLVEPEGSRWLTNAPTWSATSNPPYETERLAPATPMATRIDGGPTSWQAVIETPDIDESFREFALEFQDMQLAYTAGSTFKKRRPDELTDPAHLFRLTLPEGEQLGPTSTIPQWMFIEFFLQGVLLSPTAYVVEGQPDSCGTCGDIAGARFTLVNNQFQTDDGPCAGDLYPIDEAMRVYVPCMEPGWSDPAYAINAPNNIVLGSTMAPTPDFVSSFPPPGTMSVNYRNEPLPLRVAADSGATMAEANPWATDLGMVFTSIERLDPDLNRQPFNQLLDPTQASSTDSGEPGLKPFAFPKNPLNFNVSAFDPYTPMLNAYAGDRIQLRTLVGGQIDPHSFQVQGLSWLAQPDDPNSGYRAQQGMAISEHFEMNIQLPNGFGREQGFADYLYQPSTADSGLVNGMFGLIRAYERTPDQVDLPREQHLAELPPLPGNAIPEQERDALSERWDQVQDVFANWEPNFKNRAGLPTGFRSFHVIATTAAQVLQEKSGGSLIVNARGAVTQNATFGVSPAEFAPGTQLINPYGLIYVLAEDLAGIGLDQVLRGDLNAEPLVLRANAGDWIEVKLENRFSPRALFTVPWQEEVEQQLDGSQVPAILREAFLAEGVTLGELVSVIVCGCSWLVIRDDFSVTYKVRKTANGFEVFDATQALAWDHGVPAPFGLSPVAGEPPPIFCQDTYTNIDCNQPFTVEPVCLATSAHVGLNPQLLGLDVTQSNGLNIGFNPIQTAFEPGEVVTYYWYAGRLERGAEGQLTETPVEFGSVNLRPAEPLVSYRNGLYAALIVEPEDSVWVTDANTRTSATVFRKGESGLADRGRPQLGELLFRESVAVFQENQNVWQANFWPVFINPSITPPIPCIFPINYRSEPATLNYQLPFQQAVPFRSTFGVANFAWQSNAVVARDARSLLSGDPETPVFHSAAGVSTRIRLLYNGGGILVGPQMVVMVDGHQWQETPYVAQSSKLGDQSQSATIGAQQLFPNESANLLLASAGGEGAIPGDYLIHTFTAAQQGNWGMMRVSDRLIRIDKAFAVDGYLQLSGTVMGGGQMAANETVILTWRNGATGEIGFLGLATTSTNGSWQFRTDLKVPPGSSVCAGLTDGTCGQSDGKAALADVHLVEAPSSAR